MNSNTIVGYTYRAENYCPDHIVAQLTANPGNADHATAEIGGGDTGTVEDHLDLLARLAGIDRHDEYAFDSGDFPKVILVDQMDEAEACGVGGHLIYGDAPSADDGRVHAVGDDCGAQHYEDNAGRLACGQDFMAGAICSLLAGHLGPDAAECLDCGGDWVLETCTCEIDQPDEGDNTSDPGPAGAVQVD